MGVSSYLWYMKSMQLKNVVWKEGKYFVAQCLNVEVSSFGSSRDEALKNLEEAIALYFDDNDAPEIHEVESPELSVITVG
jgi:predicted RNase H-like HicB family nuclease